MEIERDWRSAPLDERRMAILDYSVKLTKRPGSMAKADIAALRDVGLSDRDISDVCEVTAYFAYVNRIADGLGVAVEDWFEEST